MPGGDALLPQRRPDPSQSPPSALPRGPFALGGFSPPEPRLGPVWALWEEAIWSPGVTTMTSNLRVSPQLPPCRSSRGLGSAAGRPAPWTSPATRRGHGLSADGSCRVHMPVMWGWQGPQGVGRAQGLKKQLWGRGCGGCHPALSLTCPQPHSTPDTHAHSIAPDTAMATVDIFPPHTPTLRGTSVHVVRSKGQMSPDLILSCPTSSTPSLPSHANPKAPQESFGSPKASGFLLSTPSWSPEVPLPCLPSHTPPGSPEATCRRNTRLCSRFICPRMPWNGHSGGDYQKLASTTGNFGRLSQ